MDPVQSTALTQPRVQPDHQLKVTCHSQLFHSYPFPFALAQKLGQPYSELRQES